MRSWLRVCFTHTNSIANQGAFLSKPLDTSTDLWYHYFRYSYGVLHIYIVYFADQRQGILELYIGIYDVVGGEPCSPEKPILQDICG